MALHREIFEPIDTFPLSFGPLDINGIGPRSGKEAGDCRSQQTVACTEIDDRPFIIEKHAFLRPLDERHRLGDLFSGLVIQLNDIQYLARAPQGEEGFEVIHWHSHVENNPVFPE